MCFDFFSLQVVETILGLEHSHLQCKSLSFYIQALGCRSIDGLDFLLSASASSFVAYKQVQVPSMAD